VKGGVVQNHVLNVPQEGMKLKPGLTRVMTIP